LDENTNLTYISKNKSYDFIDEKHCSYQLKTFTENGLNFRPSNQVGSGRKFNRKEFEDYCNTQTFIIASIVKFPTVQFKLFSGAYLLEKFSSGKVGFTKHDDLFSVFSFVDPSQANIAITRAGAHTGKIRFNNKTNFLTLARTTHFFINSDEKIVDFLKGIKQIECESINRSGGRKYLTKKKLKSILKKIQESVFIP